MFWLLYTSCSDSFYQKVGDIDIFWGWLSVKVGFRNNFIEHLNIDKLN